MIITSTKPFGKKDIEELKEEFGSYIKTVIDIRKKVCSAGANRHFESEQLLLKRGSEQADIWGGGIDLETGEIDFNSFINIRPRDNNLKNEIQSEEIKEKYNRLTKYFFREMI